MSYADLLADVPEQMDNDSAELTAALPGLIAQAETRLSRDLQIDAFNFSTASTLTTSSPSFALPSDLTAVRYLSITLGTGEERILERRLEGYLREYWANPGLAGEVGAQDPKYYAIADASTGIVAPTPGSAFPFTLKYRGRLPALASGSPTNWYTEYAYDLLLAACCVEAAIYLSGMNDNAQDQALIVTWQKKYQERLAAVMMEQGRRERDDYAIRVYKPDNTGAG